MTIGPSADRLREFKAIVDCRSITGAAKQLQLPRATLSRRLAELEEDLGVRLLQRTTRRLDTTGPGQELYVRACRVVEDVDAAWDAVRMRDKTPRGPLRVAVQGDPMAADPFFIDFCREFPEVELEVLSLNSPFDLRAERVDVALTFGEVRDEDLIVKRLTQSVRIPMVARGFFDDVEVPKTLDAFAALPSVVILGPDGAPERRWTTVAGGHVELEPRLVTNSFDLMVRAAAAGLGVGLLPEEAVLRYPELVAVLPELVRQDDAFNIVYVERDFQLPNVRTFIDRAALYWKDRVEAWPHW